jgi:hypothetical protein
MLSLKIKNLVAGLLLIVLLISTLPKLYIHQAFAGHTDTENACHHKTHKDPCLRTAGINCHFNDLVVNLPFIDYPGNDIIISQNIFAPYKQGLISPAPSCFFESRASRGPPKLV